MDQRNEVLARNLVNYSCAVKPGDNVLINYNGTCATDLITALVREVYKAKGLPYVKFTDPKVERALLMGMEKEQAMLMAKIDAEQMSHMDCFISVRSGANVSELADVPAEKIQMYDILYGIPVHKDIRIAKTRWCVLRYPSDAMSQLAGMSTEAFADFYYNVCNLDYSKMAEAMAPLVDLMNRTDKVRLVSPGTDLTFSIKGIPAVPCSGHHNIPDGEVYTAPVRDSVNGVITYNTPSTYNAFSFSNVRLEFKDGKIINASANDNAKVNEIFDTDEGARYVGEFAIGVNPHINKPMDETLFDEKIAGSIHFTPGMCYDTAPNGNKSAIHWDLVLIMTPEYGGGEIYFDDVLIRKDGRFVIPELACLNPENLI